jgi:hypothetical protein
MTGDQSRLLKVGDHVCWGFTRWLERLGNEVSIDWDDGHMTSIHSAGRRGADENNVQLGMEDIAKPCLACDTMRRLA